jgi:CubicO group peptidase (beta-lactamase class C family)
MRMKPNGKHKQLFFLLIIVFPFLLILIGSGGCNWNLERIDYTPISDGDWEVSIPAEQGLDPTFVAKLYSNATKVETLHALLVVKNGYLIAERYFGEGSIDQETRIQSATKSYTSALVGIALARGYLSSVDQKMIEFFPELAERISDPRKNRITIRHMLQMRAGYPWEESTRELFELLYSGFRPSNLVDVPLVREPGTGFEYSSLTSHLLGIIVARATGTDLKSFAQAHLFGPLGVEPADWIQDWEGYYNGHGDLHLSAREMARFGQLYLDDGEYEGRQLIPAAWVHDSLQTYSEDAWDYRVGRNVVDMGYGYQWWSVRAGDHHYNLAWGHGGQQIALLNEHNLLVVVKADPLIGQHGARPWKLEKANLNLVGDFISSLPSE